MQQNFKTDEQRNRDSVKLIDSGKNKAKIQLDCRSKKLRSDLHKHTAKRCGQYFGSSSEEGNTSENDHNPSVCVFSVIFVHYFEEFL